VECVREDLMVILFNAANTAVHEYMQKLIVHYGNDTTAIATTADTALYQVRSAVGAALALVGSTVSAAGMLSVSMSGCVSYQHAEQDYLGLTVTNLVSNTVQEGGDTNDETKEPTATEPVERAVDGKTGSDETPAENTETVNTADTATTTQTDTATPANTTTTEGTAK
jgi:hypothetical protein